MDGSALEKFLRQLSVTLEFWTKERSQVKKIWEEVKTVNYYLEQDPINEKIKTGNESIIRLTNRCQQYEKRIAVLAEEQNKNILL